MNAKQKSGMATIRTSEAVPASGLWRNECSREGCRFVEDVALGQGVPAPPCRHCCNSSQLRYLGPAPIAADEVRVGTIAGPHHFTTRVGDLTLTWNRGAPPAPAELPAAAAPAPTEEKAVAPAPPAEEVQPKVAMANPPDEVVSETPAIAEEKPSLFQKLQIKKPASAPRSGKQS